MLTPAELKQIKEYLMMYGKKDSQFRVLSELSDNDLIAFVRSHENFATHLTDIKDFIAITIADEGVHDSEGNPLVMSEENFTTLLKDKLGDIEANAQVNVIEDVKVNGSSLIITDKSVNVELIPTNYVKNYSDPIHPIGELGNQLLGERDINAKIAESEAEFKGTTSPDLTLAQFKTWLGNLTADRNDYVFYVATYTDERVDSDDDKYIYYRYKYTGAEEDIDDTPWPCVAGWTYEYQLIPYYLNTDEHPTEGSKNAVESNGIWEFTGTVHTDGNGNYIPLQTQIDNIVSGGATLRLTSTKDAALVNETTTFNLTATSDTEASSIKIKLGDTVIASGSGLSLIASNVSLTPLTVGNTTYTAEFVISGVTKTTTTNVAGVYPVYVGAAATIDYSNIPSAWKQTARTSPAGTYNIASIGEYIWFIYPATMTITSATMNGFDFPLEAATSQTVGGVSYKTRRSSAPQEAGKTLTIVIE